MQTTSMAELTIRITQGVGKQTPVAIVPFGVGSGLSKISENISILNDYVRVTERFCWKLL